MKSLKIISLAIMLCTGIVCAAQSPAINWSRNPVLHTVKPGFAKESAVVLDDLRIHEYRPDEKKGLIVHISNYKLIKINDDKGVEMYNKMYIPVPAQGEITEVRARVISPSGKVTDLPEQKILDVEEEGRRYKKFAFEGVENGCEIEYLYIMEKEMYFFGLEMFQNSASPSEKVNFILSVPEHLLFSVKGYNGVKVTADTIIGKQRIVTASCSDITVLEDEKYGERTPLLKNVQYKLSYNLGKDKDTRMFTWNELAKNVYSAYTTASGKEEKAVEGLVNQIKTDGNATEEQKVVALEEYLKTNINIDKNAIGEDAGKIEKIVKTKVAGNDGFTKLFVLAMIKMGIRYQLVYPSKRNDLPLDEKLENFRMADDLLFYFPETGNFLEPVNQMMRYPYVDPFLAATKGLFLRPTTIGSFNTAIAAFDTIPIKPCEASNHNMNVSLRFNSTMDSVILHSKQQLLGYGATYHRPAYSFLDKEKADEFTLSIIKAVAKSENISNVKVENKAMGDFFLNKPLNIEADIISSELVEKAGGKLLIKIGEVIGPQEQMYQEKPRQLPITIQYPHDLDRDIELEIPDGYYIKNPEAINFNVTDLPGSAATMGFISTYTLSGNKLLIKIHEFYKQVNYPISVFEVFKKIINASADFNKVVLIMEKKK